MFEPQLNVPCTAERVTAEREVAGAGPILSVLK